MKSENTSVATQQPKTAPRFFQFRVWNVRENRFEKDFAIDKEGDVLLYHDGDHEYNGYYYLPINIPFKNLIIQQSTEITDKNGVQIFEGDILSIENHLPHIKPFVVEYKEDDCCQDNWIGYSFNSYDVKEYKYIVLGNIFENPELLDR